MNEVTLNLDNLSEDERAQILRIAEKANAGKEAALAGTKDGETFMVGGIAFIKFPSVDGMTPAVAKDILFTSRFGDNNSLAESTVLKKLQEEVLPKIIADVGAEKLCTIKTDLTTLDGLKPYADLESLISLPTFDFYRENVNIFDQYKVDEWWWLATPESAQPHDNPRWVVCVAPSGRIGSGNYDYDFGVRPFLLFESSIFESSEE